MIDRELQSELDKLTTAFGTVAVLRTLAQSIRDIAAAGEPLAAFNYKETSSIAIRADRISTIADDLEQIGYTF